jgi:hypothetical protein
LHHRLAALAARLGGEVWSVLKKPGVCLLLKLAKVAVFAVEPVAVIGGNKVNTAPFALARLWCYWFEWHLAS